MHLLALIEADVLVDLCACWMLCEADVLADSDALVDALCIADSTAICLHLLKHFMMQILADLLALVEALFAMQMYSCGF